VVNSHVDDVSAATIDGAGRVVIAHGSIVARLTADGVLDPSFAPCAVTFNPFHGPTPVSPLGWRLGILEQPDGKLVVVGQWGTFRYLDESPTCQPARPRGSKLISRPPRAGSVYGSPKLKWTWKSSGTVAVSDFGDPVTGTDSYIACLLAPDLMQGFLVDTPNQLNVCPYRTCWAAGTRGYRRNGISHGEAGLAIQLRAGGPGSAKLILKGLGFDTRFVRNAPYSTPLTVRFDRNGSAFCWDATFSAPQRNDDGGFKATSD